MLLVASFRHTLGFLHILSKARTESGKVIVIGNRKGDITHAKRL